MDIFDKYIFDEVVELYSSKSLSEEEYEEIYQRMLSIEHLEEVQPYLYVMRYFGWGTKQESDKVLEELEHTMENRNFVLKGIYYDLLLCQDESNEEMKMKLYELEDMGYTDGFLKGESHIRNSSGRFLKKKKEKNLLEKSTKKLSKYSSTVNNGFIYYESGNLEDSERTFRRILMGDISCAEAYLGMLLFSEGKEQEEYHGKFIRYASEDMRELEIVLCTSKIKEKFLDIYAEIQDKECFKTIIELDKNDISFHAMYLAVKKFKDTEILEFLLEHGANPNNFKITESEYGKGQECILDICVRNEENIDKVRILIKYNVDLNYINKGYYSETGSYYERNALCTAIRFEQLEMVKLLLKNNIDIDCIDMTHNQYGKDMYNALSLAIQYTKNVEMVHLLLAGGVDINYITKGYLDSGDYYERNILGIAIRYEQLEIVKLLLKNNVDINGIDITRNQYGESRYNVLSLAVSYTKNLEIVCELLKRGADVNYINKGYSGDSGIYFEKTALVEAVNYGLVDIVKILLEHGANPNNIHIIGKSNYSVLGCSIWNKKDFEMARLLVEYGADVNYVDKWYSDNKYYERTPLCHAIVEKNIEVIEFLLKYGANPSQVNEFISVYDGVECKGPALFFAIMWSQLDGTDVEMIEILLKYKSVLDGTIIFDGKEYIMKKFPINKMKIDERILARLQSAGWKGRGMLGIF